MRSIEERFTDELRHREVEVTNWKVRDENQT
jgi:hypothetical protein